MARSCGTCRDRRIACDKAHPVCTQCRHSKRACKGYGMRLSWPRANDARRAVVSRSVRGAGAPDYVLTLRYQVEATSEDVELHRYLLGLVSKGFTQRALSAPASFSLATFTDTEGQLIEYFEQTASQCLAVLGHDPRDLGHLLLRMALGSPSTPSSRAVLNAILALSSLHKHTMHPQAFEFKIAALKALGEASAASIIGTDTEPLHVAAGMLLCSFEIQEASCTSGQWRFYITGVKKIIASSFMVKYRYGRDREKNSDVATLLDWVHYHDALARFSALHWNREPHNSCFPAYLCEELDSGRASIFDVLPVKELTSPSSVPSLAVTMLKILEYGCQALVTRGRSLGPGIPGTYSIQLLAEVIQPLPFAPQMAMADPVLELFYHAVFVYLNRASDYTLEPPSTTDRRIARSYTVIPSSVVCPRQFPLFVLGSEANTDYKRCAFLELFERTEKTPSSRSVFLTREFVRRVWVQDDLALGDAVGGGEEGCEGRYGYSDKLGAVLNGCGILPPFV